MAKQLDLITPGEILFEEFLQPMGVSQNQLARALRVPPGRVNDIVHGKRSITRDSAARLAVYFGTSANFWINLQAEYDTKVVVRDILPDLTKRIRPHGSAA